MSDKGALITSQAGMRLIAQQTLLNRGDFARLRGYIAENYATAALDSQPVQDRLEDLQALAEQAGKLRVYQVVGASKHQAVAVMEAQRSDAFYMLQVAVEEDYPHKITAFILSPLE
ncbi:MAG: hypothetical protein K8J31_07930 [Anaerolineae bacterium]|nr:hypothetical protein [Anaerolineae bacterium]